MKINDFPFLFLILSVLTSFFICCAPTQKFEGDYARQISCTPTRFVPELLETKIEILSFLTWNPKVSVTPPTIVGGIDSLRSQIRYPEIARRMVVSGPVICEFTINTDGKATNIIIVKPIGAGCDEAVREAIYSTKYIPAKKDGKNIDQLMRASFNFILIKKKP